jgi:hypothetical protein
MLDIILEVLAGSVGVLLFVAIVLLGGWKNTDEKN